MAGVPISKESVSSSTIASGSPSSGSDLCRKKKTEGASFLEDVKDHINEFMHASMEEHKSCVHRTMGKMFGLTKAVGPRPSPVESVLPLRVTTTDS